MRASITRKSVYNRMRRGGVEERAPMADHPPHQAPELTPLAGDRGHSVLLTPTAAALR